MKRHFLGFCLAAVLLIGVFCPLARAETPDFPAQALVLMEASTGQVLYEKSAHVQRPCASITKVMTLLLVFESIDAGTLHLDDVLTASAHAAGMGGSDIWLKEGEQMTVDDLIKACVVMSANDAAVVLAEAVAGSEDAFVERMNARAAELGMNDTVFKNCNGLDEDGHITSAYDVAVMSRALMQHEKIFDYTLIWIDYVRDGQTQLVNTNKLVRTYDGILGLKTGTTSAAGSCISAAAERNGMRLIAVVLGAENTKDRFSAASSLLNYGFANFTAYMPAADDLAPIPVTLGTAETVQPVLEGSDSFVIEKTRAGDMQTAFDLPETLAAPIQAGQRLGEMTVSAGGETVLTVPIIAEAGVDALGLPELLISFVRGLAGNVVKDEK